MTGKDNTESDRSYGSYGQGVGASATLAAGLAGLIALVVHELPDDPLKPILTRDQQKEGSPDKLAQDIAKDPKLQERWKLMREFVEKVDREVGHNLEQATGGSQETAKHWKDRLSETNGPDVHPVR